MKKNQKIAALLTAGLLALTPIASFGMTVFAADENPFTITVNEEIKGYTYTAYQIFKGDVIIKDGEKVLSNIDYADGLNQSDFLTNLAGSSVLKTGDKADFSTAMTIDNVIEQLKKYEDNDTKLAEFARIAKGCVSGGTENAAQSGGKYPITLTEGGYYLVEESGDPEMDPAGKDVVYSRFMLDVVGPMTVDPKRDLPTLDKKITSPDPKDDGKANSVSIGDRVSYEITSDMPDRTGYTKYFYVINDTLAEGLTFVPDSVNVTINGNDLDDDDYVVQTGEDASPYTFQIVFKDFLNRPEKKDDPIVVTYDAILNEKANRGTTGNLNTANLTYSNKPNEDYGGTPPTVDEPGQDHPTGVTPDKETKTYTANIKLTKVDESGNTLTGAKFKLTGTSANVVLINGTAYEKNASGTFYKLKNGTFTTTAPDGNEDDYDGTDTYAEVKNIDAETTYGEICMEAYVKSDGTLEFGGLGPGTYTLTEEEAPGGYNKLTDPITIELKNDGAKFEAPAWTATKDGEAATVSAAETSVLAAFNIVNKAGNTLPSTGGIGTKLFYLLGGLLAIGSGIVLVTKKRMAGSEE